MSKVSHLAGFDADFYLKAYPDIAAVGVDPHLHYTNCGQLEGRLPRLPEIVFPGLNTFHMLDSDKETVLVVCHEGSRTGAPILGYNIIRELLKQYNVVALFLGPGPILEAARLLGAVVIGPTPAAIPVRLFAVYDALVTAILEKTALRFAIINSVVARFLLEPLARRYIPTVSLLHEFAAYTRPQEAFSETVFWSGVTVFSTRLTRDNARDIHLELQEIDFPILPQGRCFLPESDVFQSYFASDIRSRVRPKSFPSDGIVVIGLGAVQMRKGVEFFLDCAARILRIAPDLPVRFVWVGSGYNPAQDLHYSVYLSDQIQRSGLTGRVHFIEEVENLQEVYEVADILLLSSRLDPLPNVAIDALSEGLPVLCFEHSTGIAEILKDHGLANYCVASFLDTARMTEQILALASSFELRQELAKRVKQLAVEVFQMSQYVKNIVTLAELQRERSQQEASDVSIVVEANVLQQDYAFQLGRRAHNVEAAALLYVRRWASGLYPRRKPFPGFHPGIYQEHQGLTQNDPNPLADYLRNGCPAGPWMLPMITSATPITSVHGQRIAAHIHVFYIDLLMPIIEALKQNQTSMDFLLSVASQDDCIKVAALLTKNYPKSNVDIRIVPNLGRDIGPFFTAFADIILDRYDIVGHFHTKRSPALNHEMVQIWTNFIYSLLLDGNARMADRILGVMSNDKDLGMVFADDPNILSWGGNRQHAEVFAQRLGITALPNEIVFPVGTMFWARVSALKPLFDLKLSWEEYPKEPAPYDGTMLHALERLLPQVVMSTGCTIAVTHIPGVAR